MELTVAKADLQKELQLCQGVLDKINDENEREIVLIHQELEGVRDKQQAHLTLAEAGGQARDAGDVPFSFRYFQSIERELTLPDGFEPSAINVEVKSSRQTPVRQSFPWQVVSTG